ncbi:MAG: histidine--tRNA ligase [Planctomycetes bacterium]|nr:histidine--tRNA ligase [Planctomycetota bacterium]
MAYTGIKSVYGTEDLLPEQWGHWRRLYSAARRLFQLHGYGEVRTPVLEQTQLFVKGTGENTDVVQKEMYTFSTGAASGQKSEESIALRPEGTPPAIRSYLEHDLHKKGAFRKFYYIGPMFRHERPQKARLRQFHQLGVEAIGAASPLLDAETILLALDIFRQVGLERSVLWLNSIGCAECRPPFRDMLRAALAHHVDQLCGDCRKRMDTNVLRVYDCKNEGCQAVIQQLPVMTDYLCAQCAEHYRRVKQALTRAGVQFREEPRLVRGLDYYTRTVYEIKHPDLGARSTICGGGRYDGLVELLGGPSLPCVGFAIGAEATLLAMESELGPPDETAPGLDVYVVRFDDEAAEACFEMVEQLRRAGVAADMDYEGRSSRAQMRTANRLGASFCFLIGARELESEQVLIKNMEDGKQWTAEWQAAAKEIACHLQ